MIKTKHLDPEFRRRFIHELESNLIQIATTGETPEYIETLLVLCEKHDIEPEAAAGMIPDTIKAKIETEARVRNLLPRKYETVLPIE